MRPGVGRTGAVTGHAAQIEPGLQPQSPKNGSFQMSAGDYRLFCSETAQIRSLETDRQFAKARHWQAFLRVLGTFSLIAGLRLVRNAFQGRRRGWHWSAFGTAPIEPQREIARRASRFLPNGVKQRRRSDVTKHRWHRSLAAVASCAFTRIATCRFCIDERAAARIAFFKRGQSSRDGTISKKENQMKSKIAYPALAAAASSH